MRSSIGWPNISFTNKVLTGLFIAALVTLIWFSLHLGAVRFLQVDECCNVFSARMLASGQARTILGKVDLFQVCLSWLMGGASRSIDLFRSEERRVGKACALGVA